jgi:hypothetical protein
MILPGITTSGGNNWRAQVGLVEQFDVRQVALFPTTLGEIEEREEFYRWLEERHHWLTCPAVHLRDDMERWEYEELLAFGAAVFNLHATSRALRFLEENPDIAETIFVENGYSLDEIYFEMLDLCGGACVDLAHLEDFGFRQHNDGYSRLIEELPEIEVGMTHIAAVWDEPHETPCGNGVGTEIAYEEHFVRDYPKDLEYLRRPEIAAVAKRCRYNCVELNNSIGEQLTFIEHIEQNIIGQR